MIRLLRAAWVIAFLSSCVTVTALANPVINLQAQHEQKSPADKLQELSGSCEELGISSFDVYGDFHLEDESESYLRRFELELAQEFGKEDAVFMPSGVMAQGIVLLINGGKTFACHHSSHLLLHEQEAYRELIRMKSPVVIDTTAQLSKNGYSIPPMSYIDVQEAFDTYRADNEVGTVGQSLSTLVLELPHRELGGKCTAWKDILLMRSLCDKEGVKFHCDGARIFEASCYYNEKSLREIASVFDSIYVSFYKGLGGLSGAMLLGDAKFCGDARIWLRRFGGNLYTLLPYAVSGWSGYRRHWVNANGRFPSFNEKHAKLRGLVAQISSASKERVIAFDPEIPQVNMIHGYFRQTKENVLTAVDRTEEQTGIRVLSRVAEIGEDQKAFKNGFRSRFEWNMGPANVEIDDDDFARAWEALVVELLKSSRLT